MLNGAAVMRTNRVTHLVLCEVLGRGIAGLTFIADGYPFTIAIFGDGNRGTFGQLFYNA